MIKKILYKGIIYNVIDPGKLIRFNSKYYCDQLKDGTSCMRFKKGLGGSKEYILKTYNLTEEEYYIIVVFEGNIDKVPKCLNPKCNNLSKFISLSKGYSTYCSKICSSSDSIRVSEVRGTFTYSDRCERAKRAAITQIKNGNLNLMTEKGKEISRNTQLRRSNDGTHYFKSLEHRERVKNWNLDRSKMGINPFNSNLVCIEGSRSYFKNIKNGPKICQFYIAKLLESNLYKIGVSSNINKRFNFRGSNKFQWIKSFIEGDRDYIADLEYKIKLKFHSKSVIGTETFSRDTIKDILKYIKEL